MESYPMDIELSSGADLDRVIADHSSEFVRFYLTRLDDLSEADTLLHRLHQNCTSRPHWKIDQDSLAALLEASKYYNRLELLELRLGVLRLEALDIEDGVAVRKLRQEIGAKKHPSSITSHLLDSIITEVQEFERIANVIGFTSSLPPNDSDSATTKDAVKCFFAGFMVDPADNKGEADKTTLDLQVKEKMKVVFVERIERLSKVLHKMRREQFCLRAMN